MKSFQVGLSRIGSLQEEGVHDSCCDALAPALLINSLLYELNDAVTCSGSGWRPAGVRRSTGGIADAAELIAVCSFCAQHCRSSVRDTGGVCGETVDLRSV